MSQRRFLILHADDDLGDLHDLQIHLAPLSRLGGIDLVAAGDLEGASDEALGELFADSRAVLICLSAPLLALDSVLDDRLRGFVGSGQLEVVLLRPCAHRLVPWLAATDTVPRDGRLLSELARADRDRELSHLAYRLAQEIDVDAGAGLDDLESPAPVDQFETSVRSSAVLMTPAKTEAEGSMAAPELTPAAGPGPIKLETPAAPGELASEDTKDFGKIDALDDEACRQFDETCADILPDGESVGDEAIEALVELSIVLGSSREELGDDYGARLAYEHAARSLVETLEIKTSGRQKISRYSRVTRLALKQALKDVEDGKPALATLRGALERALERAPRHQG